MQGVFIFSSLRLWLFTTVRRHNCQTTKTQGRKRPACGPCTQVNTALQAQLKLHIFNWFYLKKKKLFFGQMCWPKLQKKSIQNNQASDRLGEATVGLQTCDIN